MFLSGCGQPTNGQPTNKEGSANNRVAITISKATTYVTEPLNDEGYPDYIAALNRIASEDVRPEDNAAVILAGVVQSTAITDKAREAMFTLLGAKPPGEIEPRFVDYNDVRKRARPR